MFSISLTRLQDITIKVFISICVILPTGSLFGINVKFLSLFIVLVLALLSKNGRGFVSLFRGLFLPVLVLLIFLLITIANGRYINETNGQAQDILVFFIIATLGYSLIEKENRVSLITKTIVNCLVFLGFCKLLILGYSVVSGLGVSSVVRAISAFFDTSLMIMESDEVSISRITFMSDYLLPIAMFLKTKEYISRKTGVLDTIILFLLMYSILVSMSRFLWIISLASFIIAIVGDLKKRKSILIFVAMTSIAFFLISLPSVQEIFEFRLASNGVIVSDSLREVQKSAIVSAFNNAPFFGNGIGYFTPRLIRSDVARYSYELQIQALYMQMGVVGATSLLLIIIGTLLSQVKGLTIKEFFTFALLITMWISGGFFNPVIISSTGGVAFLFLFTIPDAMKMLRNKT
ncbi:hypothetical protein [Serratia aquatilis]|uniref:O-antigen ligase family protein n=1 Tax=Serratia aquatilis TaxID=1737515 RepID=A0ABV6EJU4_9GAMM